MSDWINRAELAARAGVSRTASAKAFREQFPDLVVDGKVDANRGAVKDYINKDRRGLPTRTKEVEHPAPKAADEVGVIPEVAKEGLTAEQVEELDGLTLREIGMRYGTLESFKKFVDVLKVMADFQFRDIKVRTERGHLIERDAVKGRIFPLIDTAFTRLVTDVPTTLSALVLARAEAGGEGAREDIEKIIRDANSKTLKNLKAQLSRNKVLE